jgi:hypothetical protein
MAQAQDALYTRKWMSEDEQDEVQKEDKFTSSSFAAALKAIAERNRLAQPGFEQPELAPAELAQPAPAKAAALKITELAEEEEEELELEDDRPRERKPAAFSRAWTWLKKKRVLGVEKQLKVSETLSLGEKRFVAILNVEGRKFLIGGGATGVSLLTQLDDATATAGVVKAASIRGVRGV